MTKEQAMKKQEKQILKKAIVVLEKLEIVLDKLVNVIYSVAATEEEKLNPKNDLRSVD